jgi:isoquinoline 1-oxidoreductase beta subunit
MGRLKTYTRRAFLIGAAATAGGVAFGTYLVKKPLDNPLAEGLSEGTATFNPWVKISAEGITLIAPHMDMGQGVASMQAMLIAEELDLNMDQFTVDFGQPSPAYYNTALASDGAPFLSSDTGLFAETARAAMGALSKVIGLQGTGGSSSVPDSYTKLRVAGAVARETLKAAAAQLFGVPRDALQTGAGAVILPDGRAVPYTDLAAIAATIDPVENVTLRDPAEWRLIGKPVERLDMLAKSTGTLAFGIDQKVEGMVYAALAVNPRKGAACTGFDASDAEKMPGVLKVVPVSGGAAVIATNTWYAMEAAKTVRCTFAEAAYPADQAAHWAAVEAAFTPETLDCEWRNDGDIDTALGETPFEAEYRAPYVAHQPLEPLNAIARVTGQGVEIWGASQMPRFLQQVVAPIAGLKPEQVVLHNQYAGGSFGHRLEFENFRYAVEIATQMPGTPVKLTFTREDDFAQDFTRPLAMARAKGAVSEGRISAFDMAVASPSVTRSQMGRIGLAAHGPDTQIVAGLWNLPYALDNLRIRGHAVEGLAPVSSWRSVGASFAGFFGESFLDELIHAAGLDPMQARIDLCTLRHARKVLETLQEMAWSQPLPQGHARGVALVESFGVPCGEVIEISNQNGAIKLEKLWVVADVGRVVDPVNIENLLAGGALFGLGHAMNCEITYADGAAEQSNFDSHAGMRFAQAPQVFTKALENGPAIRGIGEPPVPPAAPALANAIFALTGERLREMPFNKAVEFV